MKMIRLLTILLVALFMVAGTTIKRGPGGGGGSGEDVITLADPGTDESLYIFDSATGKLIESPCTIEVNSGFGTISCPDATTIGGNVFSMHEHADAGQNTTCADRDPDKWSLLDVNEVDGTIEIGVCIGTSRRGLFTADGLDIDAGRLRASGSFFSLDDPGDYPPESEANNRNAAHIRVGASQQAVTGSDSLSLSWEQYRHMFGHGASQGGFYPPETCSGGGCAAVKTKVGLAERRLSKHGDGEFHALEQQVDIVGPGDATAATNTRLRAMAGGEVQGDEGPLVYRINMLDDAVARGSLTSDMSATDTSVSVDLAASSDWNIIGERGRLVLTENPTLLTGTGSNGVTGYDSGTGTWTVQDSGQLPADPKDYCFALDSTQYEDWNAINRYAWLPVIAGPGESGCGGTCGAAEFETRIFQQGAEVGAPVAYIPGQRGNPSVSGENARMAPCEEVTGATFTWDPETGLPNSVSGTIAIKAARNAITAASGDFELHHGPAQHMQALRILTTQDRGRGPSYGVVEIQNVGGQSGVSREMPEALRIHGSTDTDTGYAFDQGISTRDARRGFAWRLTADRLFDSVPTGVPAAIYMQVSSGDFSSGKKIPLALLQNDSNVHIVYDPDTGWEFDGEALLQDPESEDIGAANVTQDQYEDGSTDPGTVRSALDGIDDKLGHVAIIRQLTTGNIISDDQCIRTDRNNVGTTTCDNANTWRTIHQEGEIFAVSAALLANLPTDVACGVGISLNESTSAPSEFVHLGEDGVATPDGTHRYLALSSPVSVSPGDVVGVQFTNGGDECEAGAGNCGTCNGVSNTETIDVGVAAYIR